jgi:hypothetical protein
MTKKILWNGRWHLLAADGRVGRFCAGPGDGDEHLRHGAVGWELVPSEVCPRCGSPAIPTSTQGVLHCKNMHNWRSATWQAHVDRADGNPVRVTPEAQAQIGNSSITEGVIIAGAAIAFVAFVFLRGRPLGGDLRGIIGPLIAAGYGFYLIRKGWTQSRR